MDSDDKQLFHNLIGNVWEYLWEDTTALESVTDKSLRSWKALLESHSNQLFVIGGSALSAPEITSQVSAPLPVDPTQMGFADVGMRLAFTARPKLPSERLKWVLASHTYLNATDTPATRPTQ